MTKIKYLLILIFCLGISTSFAQKKSKKKKDKISEEINISSEVRITSERLFFDGQREKLIGNLENSYEKFSEAVRLNPLLDAAYYEIAQLQQLAGDYVSSQKSIESALEISPKNVWYQQYHADMLAAQFKYEEAATTLNKIRTENPTNYDYYYQEAYYLILSNKLKESLVIYDEIEKAIGIQPDASLQKHKIYARLNKPEEAANELKKLIEAYPDEIEFQNDLAEFYLVNGEEEKAIALYEEILKKDPNNVYALTSLADYHKKKGDPKKALTYSRMAFANPEIPIDVKISVLFNYIKYYEQKKDQMEDAFLLSDILIEVHPEEAKVYAIAGDLRNLEEEREAALVLYNKSLEIEKDIFTVWQQVFFLNSDLRNYEELVAKTNEAKEYFPNQSIVYFFNGLGYQQLDDFSSAEKAYSRGVKMSSDNLPLKAQFYSNLGDTYNSLNEFKQSDESFEKALELEPENAYVLNNYSYYLSLREEKLDLAAKMSLLSNELEPNNSSFLDTYAWILYKNGKYKEAKEWQEKAISASETPSATLLEHLGDILFKLGDKNAAFEKWEEASKLDDSNLQLLKKIKDQALYE